jgi:hypothetical protein
LSVGHGPLVGERTLCQLSYSRSEQRQLYQIRLLWRNANTITLYEKEPRWLGRPVARAARGGRPARGVDGRAALQPGAGTTEANIRDAAGRLIRVAETMPAVPVHALTRRVGAVHDRLFVPERVRWCQA